MAIFHSYVKLPEGKCMRHGNIRYRCGCWGSDGKVCLKAAAESIESIESIFLSHFELDTSLTHMVLEVSHHWSIAGPSLGNLCGIVFTHKSEINGYVGTSILLKSALMKLMMNIYPLVNEQSYWKLPFLVDLPPTFLWFSIVFCMFTRGYTII